MNSLKLDKECLEAARRQFCLDIGLPREEYEKNREKNVLIQKVVYAPGGLHVAGEGARNYAERNSFFRAIICLGQLFICCDERIYDWVAEQYGDCKPEWFCDYKNLRKLDEKLREYGQEINDTHIYFLPKDREGTGQFDARSDCGRKTESKLSGILSNSLEKYSVLKGNTRSSINISEFVWYEQEGILRFKENNRFTSAISFWEGQPDMLAVAAMREDYRLKTQKHILNGKSEVTEDCWAQEGSCKDFDQTHMCGMAGVSRDGEYLWQIGINVDKDYAGQGLGHKLVRALKEEVLRRGKVPFYGTSESHTLSQTVGLKAGFVPAWTEVSVRERQKNK